MSGYVQAMLPAAVCQPQINQKRALQMGDESYIMDNVDL